jgi:hypothetical protein
MCIRGSVFATPAGKGRLVSSFRFHGINKFSQVYEMQSAFFLFCTSSSYPSPMEKDGSNYKSKQQFLTHKQSISTHHIPTPLLFINLCNKQGLCPDGLLLEEKVGMR